MTAKAQSQTMPIRSPLAVTLVGLSSLLFTLGLACGESSTSTNTSPDGSTPGADANVPTPNDAGSVDGATTTDASTGTDAADAADAADAGKIVPPGLGEPVSYKRRADSPFFGVVLPVYDHFEDWEDGLVNTPGVTPSSTAVGASFGALVDSVDGDDGTVDGKCEKAAGLCNSGFSGDGQISFTFDAAQLGGQLPSHVGIAWTDGSTGCDAIFEAYDAADVLIGSKTAAAVGDNTNVGSYDEDRYFTVVHAAGVKRVVVKSSAGGVEVDHLHYGR